MEACAHMAREIVGEVQHLTNPATASPEVLAWSNKNDYGRWLALQPGIFDTFGRFGEILDRKTLKVIKAIRREHLPKLPEDATEVAIPSQLLAFIREEIEIEPGWNALLKSGPALYSQVCSNVTPSPLATVDSGVRELTLPRSPSWLRTLSLQRQSIYLNTQPADLPNSKFYTTRSDSLPPATTSGFRKPDSWTSVLPSPADSLQRELISRRETLKVGKRIRKEHTPLPPGTTHIPIPASLLSFIYKEITAEEGWHALLTGGKDVYVDLCHAVLNAVVPADEYEAAIIGISDRAEGTALAKAVRTLTS
ncbi:hypothetical protein MNV49_004397 [Pseudohyphozyma bogoriensis]|nr:hypothetical protein MNV49_004397 [Pseudohyphozyma bogoriensis]